MIVFLHLFQIFEINFIKVEAIIGIKSLAMLISANDLDPQEDIALYKIKVFH